MAPSKESCIRGLFNPHSFKSFVDSKEDQVSLAHELQTKIEGINRMEGEGKTVLVFTTEDLVQDVFNEIIEFSEDRKLDVYWLILNC